MNWIVVIILGNVCDLASSCLHNGFHFREMKIPAWTGIWKWFTDSIFAVTPTAYPRRACMTWKSLFKIFYFHHPLASFVKECAMWSKRCRSCYWQSLSFFGGWGKSGIPKEISIYCWELNSLISLSFRFINHLWII